jgi:CBS domain-containing protein
MDQLREMMKVRDRMTRTLDYISVHETVQEASRLMKRRETTCLAVIRESEAVGMITDRDIVMRVVAPGLDPDATDVAAVMTKGLVVCREEDSLEIAALIMARRHLRHLVVIDRRGRLLGVVSAADLAERLTPGAAIAVLRSIST